MKANRAPMYIDYGTQRQGKKGMGLLFHSRVNTSYTEIQYFSVTSPCHTSLRGHFEGPLVYNFNAFPNKPWFLLFCSRSLLETLWERRNCL